MGFRFCALPCGPGEQTWVIKLGCKLLSRLTHLADPSHNFSFGLQNSSLCFQHNDSHLHPLRSAEYVFQPQAIHLVLLYHVLLILHPPGTCYFYFFFFFLKSSMYSRLTFNMLCSGGLPTSASVRPTFPLSKIYFYLIYVYVSDGRHRCVYAWGLEST